MNKKNHYQLITRPTCCPVPNATFLSGLRIRNACIAKHHFNQPAGNCIITTSSVISSKCCGGSVLREEKAEEADKTLNLFNISSISLFFL
jgi:hypothetical protein